MELPNWRSKLGSTTEERGKNKAVDGAHAPTIPSVLTNIQIISHWETSKNRESKGKLSQGSIMDLNEIKMEGKVLVDQPRRGRASFFIFLLQSTYCKSAS